MTYSTFSVQSRDGTPIQVHRWSATNPRAILVLAHGMIEHGRRYAEFAEYLNDNHVDVFIPDHRGHGITSTHTGLGYLGDKANWFTMVDDLHRVLCHASDLYPILPVFLMGHSMGSFLAQSYAAIHPDFPLKGLLLSGTSFEPRVSTGFGKLLSKFLMLLFGKKASGWIFYTIIFGGYARQIKGRKTSSDWLSRDPKEVNKYLVDPLCGFVPTISFFNAVFGGMYWLYSPSTLAKIIPALPLFFMSGEDDPLSRHTQHVRKLAETYQKLGHSVTECYYENARHELLNDINKDEVKKDILHWLESQL